MNAFRPVKTKEWVRFLKAHNCYYKSTTASHTKYNCPGCTRGIIFREADKEIPAFHLKQDLKTMGLTLDYLYNWLNNN